jgi:hypothetical protein
MTTDKTEPDTQESNVPESNSPKLAADRNPQRALFWDVYRNTTPALQK